MNQRAEHRLPGFEHFVDYLLRLRQHSLLLLDLVNLGHHDRKRLLGLREELDEHLVAVVEPDLDVDQKEHSLQATRLPQVYLHKLAPPFHFRSAGPGVPVARAVDQAAVRLHQWNERQVLRLTRRLRRLRVLDSKQGVYQRALAHIGAANEGQVAQLRPSKLRY